MATKKQGGLVALMKDAQGRARRGGSRCVVGTLLENLDAGEATDLREVLADDTVFATTISRVLRDLGHNVGAHSLSRHRRGECCCG